ncbi:MAG: AzlD domain-containing protein [Clostridiales bacterium]|nr:AzlD domain-containing protein [Clostridiales bacterium]
MSTAKMLLMIIAMAGVTYIIRMLPLVFFTKKIRSRYILSVLFYIPYAVLSAMTFPFIFYSTGSIYTALIGTAVAVILALFKRSLLTVAVCACLSVYLCGFIPF